MERLTGLRLPILLYHRIEFLAGRYTPLVVDPNKFAEQMDAIAQSSAATLTISEALQAARMKRVFPQGVVAITFDDATEDQYINAWPVLLRDHLRATFYVPTGRVGQPGYLTWAQIKEMRSSGLIEFGAHTITHRDLTKMSRAEAWHEIAGGKSILEKELGVPVTSFAYPFGTFGEREVTMAFLAGFSSALTTKYAWTHAFASALRWGRIEVHETNSGVDIAGLATASGDLHAVTTLVDVFG
ncbi:MAG TPA: polysaccharide deacetylase family protein [Actinomycetota bacterium]|nr:polysaccharide deacetylase family protein [Actinomycetota bacterium]